MASKTHSREKVKYIAQVLNLPERELSYLSGLSVSDLEHLHQNIEGSVSGAQSPLWPALAKSVRFFPNRVCAKITQEAMGPYIAAQMTRHLDIKTAVGIGKYFTPQFLVEVMAHISHEEAANLLVKMPNSNVKKGAMYLLAEDRHRDLGQLLEQMPKDKVAALLSDVESPKALVQIAATMDDKTRFAEAVVLFKDEQLYQLVEAASELERWDSVLEVCSFMPAKQQKRMANIAAEFDWDDTQYFFDLAEELELSDSLSVLLTGEQVSEPQIRLGRFLPWKVKGL